jgi:hypothetical protein
VVTPDGKFMTEEAKNKIIAKVALPIIGELADKKTRFTVNGTGKFLVAGPLVAMNEKKQTGKTQDQILRLFFEGVMGRQPKTDQELNEWLATPVGRAAVMFDIASVSRWGEIGRS